MLLISAVSLSACRGHLPEAPLVSPCKVLKDYRNLGPGCLCSNPQGTQTVYLKIDQCQKYRALSPQDAQAADNYVYELEKKILDGSCR